MAIDTAAKRKSAAGLRRLPGVTPDSSTPLVWRQQASRGYSGIPTAEPSAADPWTVTGTWAVPTVTGTWAVPTVTGTWTTPTTTGTWESL